ncbi:MAG: hypothetical protein MK102_06540 [Fuerstiella sp.]|nr:hypothetical protein [Fuerstiella sp.]
MTSTAPASPAGIQQHPSPSLPASGSRTVTMLGSALLLGCLLVWWFNRHTTSPIIGVLAADITALRVPSDSRLLTSHVAIGDEVFTGEILLTLEKAEHQEQIVRQGKHVQKIAADLHKAKTKAAFELEWRMQQLDLDVQESKRRVRFFKALCPSSTVFQPAAANDDNALLLTRVHTVSKPGNVLSYQEDRVNGLLFISGVSGTATWNPLSADLVPAFNDKQPNPTLATNTKIDLLQLESQNIEARIKQLAQMRSRLPARINLTTGVEKLQSEFDAAQEQYTKMAALSRETKVLCPSYGKISQLQFREGDDMTCGNVMLKIVHTDRRYIILQTPVERIDKLVPETRLNVLFPDHDPCQGVVTEATTVSDRQMTGESDTVSVRVEPIGREWPDQAVGTRVEILTQQHKINVH